DLRALREDVRQYCAVLGGHIHEVLKSRVVNAAHCSTSPLGLVGIVGSCVVVSGTGPVGGRLGTGSPLGVFGPPLLAPVTWSPEIFAPSERAGAVPVGFLG